MNLKAKGKFNNRTKAKLAFHALQKLYTTPLKPLRNPEKLLLCFHSSSLHFLLYSRTTARFILAIIPLSVAECPT